MAYGAGITRKPRWSELSLQQKAMILGVIAVQAALAAAAQRDLSARGAGQVRGPKLLWRAVTRTPSVLSPTSPSASADSDGYAQRVESTIVNRR